MAGFSRTSISDMMVKEKEAFPSTWLIRAMGSSRGANYKRALGKCQVIEMSQFVFTDSAEKNNKGGQPRNGWPHVTEEHSCR